MVLTLMLIARRVMRFEKYITAAHVDAMCKIVLGTGGLVVLAYFTELYMAWQSGNWHERFALGNRAFGSFAWAYRTMVICNVFIPQFFWFKKIRRNLLCVFAISLLVNVGMWLERFVIIVTSLHRDFLPSSWAEYSPTLIEIATLIGSFGLFFTLFLLFCRLLPVIGIAEIKAVVGSPDEQEVIETARANRAQPQEVYTPYPVHGLPEAMRLKPSRLPWIAFIFGCIGGVHALVLQFYESAIAWPVNVGGRPFNSLPAFVPVTFEVTILFAGVGTFAAFLMRHRLYPGKKPARLVAGATDDRFVLLAKTKAEA
jgi:molybdopterin-containing oxidoreductase family membrane subunit